VAAELWGMGRTVDAVLGVLEASGPLSSREIARRTGIGMDAVWSCLRRLWRGGRVVRSERVFETRNGVFRGRAGKSQNLRRYYLYLAGGESRVVDGVRYVRFGEAEADSRGHSGGESKAELVRRFLEEHGDKAFYSTEVRKALSSRGVKQCDVMASVRRLERKGLVYVRGYQTGDRQTPFAEGYLVTWIDQGKPREEALREAVDRTTRALEGSPATHPIIHRVHLVRDQIIAASHLRELVGFEQLREKLGCSEYEAEGAVKRALQLYPDLKEVKIFGRFRYYYHASMGREDLEAAVEMKRNYVRATQGRRNRIGHNWEAAVEWFIDRFTRGAEFQTQQHRRRGMDPRRITLHLVRPVGGRRRSAEVDRVWTVTPGPFAQPITYVLECKWGLLGKHDLDGFLEVLKWSREFGADTERGRVVRNGVVGVFAASAFNPRARIRIGGEEITLPAYAARLNIQMIHPADLNRRLHERVKDQKVTVQRICRLARDEKEVRETLTGIWEKPKSAERLLQQLAERNRDLYELERQMETEEH